MSWDWVREKYEGKKVQGRIVRLLPKGALVELENNIIGLIQSGELAWSRRLPKPTDIFSHGQEVEVLVLTVDVENERMILSYKQALGNPWQGAAQKYGVGSTWPGDVVQLMPKRVFIELEPGVTGSVYISQIAPWKIEHTEEALAIGDSVFVKVLSCDEENKRIELSIKAYLIDIAQKGGKNYNIIDSGSEEAGGQQEHEGDEETEPDSESGEAIDPGIPSIVNVPTETIETRKNIKILLVDDEECVRKSSHLRLKQAWFEVHVASGGEEALRKAKDNQYEIILMDVQMPDMDGLEVTRTLREQDIDTPVVLFTAHFPTMYFGAHRQKFPGLNIVNVLRKPLDFVEVAQTIDEVVSGLPVSLPMEMLPEQKDTLKQKQLTQTASENPLEKRVGDILADLQNNTGAEALALFCLDTISYETKMIVSSGISPNDFEHIKHNLRYSPVKDVIEDQIEFLEGNVKQKLAKRFKNLLPILTDGFRSCIGLPVKIADRVEHAIFIFHPEESFFDLSDLYQAKEATTLIGAEIENSKIRDSLFKSHTFTQRGQMVSSLIHELRNRLMTLSNYADVVAISFDRFEKGQSDLDDQDQRAIVNQAISGILTAKNRMDDLANTFSEMGKDEDHKLLNVNLYVPRVLKFLEPAAEFANIRLENSLDDNLPDVMTTGMSIEQIILNLVLNAIQLMELEDASGGVIEVRTTHEPQYTELPIKVRVKDKGPGIHKRDFERVFSLGFTSREGGAGLGLFISRKLAKDLGGKISVETSTIFSGTTFLLELPTSK